MSEPPIVIGGAQVAENAIRRLYESALRLTGEIAYRDDRIAELERENAELKGKLNDTYSERNQVVGWAARMARALGYYVAVTKTDIEGWDSAWHNCVYVGTPEGQVSWHFHDDDGHLFEDCPHDDRVKWDGHSTTEKYERIKTARYGHHPGCLEYW